MSILLTISLSGNRVTTLNLPRVSVTLSNNADTEILCPIPGDPGNMIFVETRNSTSGASRVFDGIQHQRMMSGARIDEQTTVQELDPMESRSWDLDLCVYDYTLGAGTYQIRAGFVHTDRETVSYSEWHALDVHKVGIGKIQLHRECPVLDGTTVLIKTAGSGGFLEQASNDSGREDTSSEQFFVRLHNTKRPLAAWYCQAVESQGGADAFLARKNYFSTETLDHFFRHWLLETRSASTGPDYLFARHLDWGAETSVRQAQVPEGCELMHSAVVTEDDQIYCFFLDDSRKTIQCHILSDSGLTSRFNVSIPDGLEGQIHVFGDCDYLFFALPHDGILLYRLSYDGEVLNRTQLVETSHPFYSMRIDPVDRILKAAFVNSLDPHKLIFHAVRPADKSRKVFELTTEALFTEMDWDYDHESGQFYCLTHETDACLRFYETDMGPVIIENDPDVMEIQHFPTVISQGGVYLGYYQQETGFRIGRFTKQHGFDNPHRKL